MNDKTYYHVVFVVLVYKNIDILRDFFTSLKISSTFKVIVVNSHYDDSSERECKRIAEANNADFLSIPNHGYSYGNNMGCQYAIGHYTYAYLIVSNSDIIIKELDYLDGLNHKRAVYAPDIRIKDGHRQNPNIPFASHLYLRLLDWAYIHDSYWVMKCAQAINRIYREAFLIWATLIRKEMRDIFALHGSFIIFTYQASIDLNPIFLNEMFLYNEELYLAYHCRMKHIPLFYVPKLKIIHLDGASSSKDNHREGRASYLELRSWMKKQGIKC